MVVPMVLCLRELSRELSWGDRTLDLVIGTHPDKDHIGGLIDVLARYKVASILTTENTGETTAASAYQKALLAETDIVHFARAGQVYTLGASTTITVLSPARDPSMLESNTSSIVVKVSYGESDFMLTGDAHRRASKIISVSPMATHSKVKCLSLDTMARRLQLASYSSKQ
jgi:competence protein ComEC